jgi:ABC-type multidrug transport system permease subunit
MHVPAYENAIVVCVVGYSIGSRYLHNVYNEAYYRAWPLGREQQIIFGKLKVFPVFIE